MEDHKINLLNNRIEAVYQLQKRCTTKWSKNYWMNVLTALKKKELLYRSTLTFYSHNGIIIL